MKKIKALVVGAGRMGTIHALNLKVNPQVELVGVVDIDIDRAKKLSEQLHVPAYNDFLSALKSQKPDMVVIAVSTQYHAPLIRQAAENGVHVFVEKPMGLNTEQNQEIARIVDKYGIKLQVGFQRLYDESFIRAKKLIDDGKIGKPLIAKLISRDPSPTPGIGTILYPGAIYDDMAIHDFSVMIWLFGFKKMKVYASGAAYVFKEYKEAGDFDNSLINIKYEDGPLVDVEVSRCSKYGYDIRLEVLGENGMVKVENRTEYETFLFSGDSILHPTYEWFEVRFRDAYRREIEAFIDSLIKDTNPFPDHNFAVNVGKVSDAAKKSAATGEPVTIE